jgi:hypothetical protein
MNFKMLSAMEALVFNSSTSLYSNKISFDTQILILPEMIQSNTHR